MVLGQRRKQHVVDSSSDDEAPLATNKKLRMNKVAAATTAPSTIRSFHQPSITPFTQAPRQSTSDSVPPAASSSTPKKRKVSNPPKGRRSDAVPPPPVVAATPTSKLPAAVAPNGVTNGVPASTGGFTAAPSISTSVTRPLRILKYEGGVQDVSMSFSRDLDFTYLPNVVTVVGGGKGKGKEGPAPKPARLESIADADAFLGFAFARGRATKWKGVRATRAKVGAAGTAWCIEIIMVGEEESQVVVRVTVGPKLSDDKSPDVAELAGKLEVARALIHPGRQLREFLLWIDDKLAGSTQGLAAEREAARVKKDREGEELFQQYRQVHPRLYLPSLEAKFRTIGDLEYQNKCDSLLDIIHGGLESAANGGVAGFGPWVGEVETGLKKICGWMHAFCIKQPEYLADSLETLARLLHACTTGSGGHSTEVMLEHYITTLEGNHRAFVEKYRQQGVDPPKPKTFKDTPRRLVIVPPPPPAPKPLPAASPVPIYCLPFAPEAPVAPVSPKRSASADVPPADPRGPWNPKRSRLPPPAPIVTPKETALVPVAPSPPAPALDTTTTRKTMSPAVGSPAFSSRLSARSPVIAAVNGAASAAHLDVVRKSTPPVRVSRLAAGIVPKAPPRPPLINNYLRPQISTPEATPELKTSEVVAPRAELGDCFSHSDSTLQDPLVVEDRTAVIQWTINIDQKTLLRLRSPLSEDTQALVSRLPLQSHVIFTCTTPLTIDSPLWPSITLSVNNIPVPVVSQMKGSRVLEFMTVDISNQLRQGANVLKLSKWRTDKLPDGFSISTQLFRCYSEAWLRKCVDGNVDLDRTYELYTERTRDKDSVLSLEDPTSGCRITSHVRGRYCDHLEAFDLDTFIASNKKGNVGRWLCPIAGCGKSAAPPDLYISAWMDDASLEHPDSKSFTVGKAAPDVEMEDVKPNLKELN